MCMCAVNQLCIMNTYHHLHVGKKNMPKDCQRNPRVPWHSDHWVQGFMEASSGRLEAPGLSSKSQRYDSIVLFFMFLFRLAVIREAVCHSIV